MKYAEKIPLLLVDDEEDIRDVLELTLTDLGYTVFTASNGESALRIFKEKRPEIVLTDIKMPGMDGVELLRQIKQESPSTEVIMITGHGDTSLAIKSLKHEAIDFIPKPINDEVLEVALKRAMDKIEMRHQMIEYTQSLEALVREKAEMQDHLTTLGLMIGSISHGVKGQLTRLDAGLYELETALQKNDPVRMAEGYRIVKGSAGRIKKMVLDILFYSKERDLKMEKVRLTDFSRDVASVIESKAAGAEIAFHSACDESAGEAVLDAERIHSALVNILENAVDACAEHISQKAKRIDFKVSTDKDHVCFRIQDNGVGMNQETRENIFNLFFSAKGKKGTGLGLFIANRIIRQHDGTISVQSTPGKGSEFIVRLPKKS
ncbi:MAG: hybrid sensor histidine kinase/response regulator [Desulfobacterales bacterium]